MTDLPEWLSEKIDLRLSRKNIIIPESIHIQLVDHTGTNVLLENVLCSLHIMFDDVSYYTCGFLPTDQNGSINLSKEDIVEKSELKHYYDPTLPLFNNSTRFEFSICDNALLEKMISQMDDYLSLPLEHYRKTFEESGVEKNQIEKNLETIKKKNIEDLDARNFLNSKNNQKLNYNSVNSVLKDEWLNEYKYCAVLVLKT